MAAVIVKNERCSYSEITRGCVVSPDHLNLHNEIMLSQLEDMDGNRWKDSEQVCSCHCTDNRE